MNTVCRVFAVCFLFGVVFGQTPQLWGVGSCSYSTETPVSFSIVDPFQNGDFAIQFNYSVTTNNTNHLMVFFPAPITADYGNRRIYITGEIITSNNAIVPSQVLLEANLATRTVSTTLYSTQSSKEKISVMAALHFDSVSSLLYAIRVEETINPFNGTVFLDIVKPNGMFKQVYAIPYRFTTYFSTLDVKNQHLIFATFDYQNDNIEDFKFVTFDFRSGSIINSVAINTSALTVGNSPANYSYVSSIHYDPVSDQIIAAGNLIENYYGSADYTVWAGYFNSTTGEIRPMWFGSYRQPNGQNLYLATLSTFNVAASELTVKLMDPDGDGTASRLVTLSTSTWQTVADVKFQIEDSYCITSLVWV